MKLTDIRRRVLSEVEDLGQGYRIASRLGVAETSVSSALQWARRQGLCEYGSRWKLTPAGRAALESRND